MGSTSIHEKGPWDWMKGGAEGGGGKGRGSCSSKDALAKMQMTVTKMQQLSDEKLGGRTDQLLLAGPSKAQTLQNDLRLICQACAI